MRARKYLLVAMVLLLIFLTGAPLFAWNKQAPLSNVLIFVSFSMPKESLRGWLRQADLIKAPVIIRGLLHNSFRDTTKATMEIVANQHGGIQLDPSLFQRFQIEKVPAVVVISSGCLLQQECKDADVIYGDVTLDYALKEIVRQNDSLSSYAASALQQLKAEKA